MTSVSSPGASASAWVDDVRALILDSRRAWGSERPLAQYLRATFLAEGMVAGTELRDRILVAALAHADARAHVAVRREENALREGVRGYLWLPRTLDEDFTLGLIPSSGDDVAVVTKGSQRVNRQSIMQRQCWAGLLQGRALGAEYTSKTARQYGYEQQALYADRLVADLDAFLADEEAVEYFITGALPLAELATRFQGAGLVLAGLRTRLRRIGATLTAVPPYYPQHLTPVELAADRQVAASSTERSPFLRYDAYYGRAAEADETLPALETLLGERRAVLLGDPGSGKSTIARAAVLRTLQESQRAVAVFVSAAALARALPGAPEGWRVTLARQALSHPLFPEPTDDTVRQLAALLHSEPSAYVVLDGIDEVLDMGQAQHLAALITALETLPGRVLLTSRHIGYRTRPGWNELVAMPLRGGFAELLEQWYGETDTEARTRAEDAYQHSDSVRTMVTHPVLAGLVASLAADPSADLRSGRAALYRQAVMLLCERNWKAPHQALRSEDEVMTLVGAYEGAAWTMAVGDGHIPDAVRWETVTSYAQLHRAGVDVRALREGDLFVAYGTPRLSADVDRPWMWLHRSFADYFVGAQLALSWIRDPEGAEAIMWDALQYPTAWTEPLRFFVELASEPAKAAFKRVARALCAEGDPGGIVRGLMEEVLSYRDPDSRLFSRHGVDRGESAFAFRVAEWLYADGPAPTPQELRRDLTHAPDWIRGVEDEVLRRDLIRSYLHRTRTSIPREFLYALKMSDRIDVAIARILDPSHPQPLDLVAELTYPDDPADFEEWMARFTAPFRQLRFPETIRIAETVQEHAVAVEPEKDNDEVRLMLWAAAAISRPDRIPEGLVAGPALIDRVIRGEWGEWGAFNAGVLAPEAALRCRDASRYAKVAAHLRPLRSIMPRSRAEGALPADLAARFDAFDVEDVADIEKVDALVGALRFVDVELPDEATKSLLLLATRLGGVPEKGDELQDLRMRSFVYDEPGLRDGLRVALWELLGEIDEDRVEILALELYRAGADVKITALPGFALVDATPDQQRQSVELLEFALATGPSRLNGHVEVLLSDTNTVFTQALFERFGNQIAQLPGLFSQLTWGLSWAGLLPSWRARLLALQASAESTSASVSRLGE